MIEALISCMSLLCCQIHSVKPAPFPNKSLIWSSKTDPRRGPILTFIPGGPADVSRDNIIPSQITFSTNVVSPEASIHSVCSDHQAGTVYFAEFHTSAFLEMDTNSKLSRIVHQGIGDSFQMTVDWSSKTLYWVDGLFSWIAVKPLRKGDPFDYRVLLESEVEHPLGVAVDPKRAHLFWTEVGRIGLVKRARLDGDSPRVIVVGGLYNPLALTIDIQTGKIYWVDRTKETVEYCDSDGSERNVLRKVNSLKLESIAYYKNLLFVTDQKKNRVIVFREGTGFVAKSYQAGVESLRDITVYAPENQPSLPDPCKIQNCEHFCVKSGPSSARCLCQNGFTLSWDDRSCTGSSVYAPRLITYANKTHVCFINITALVPGVPLTPYCPVSDGVDITAVSPDSKNRTVYYADRGKGQISRVSLRSGQSSVVLNNIFGTQGRVFAAKVLPPQEHHVASNRHQIRPNSIILMPTGPVSFALTSHEGRGFWKRSGLSYEWLSDTLYWTDSAKGQINSYRLGSAGPPLRVLTTTDTFGPLALDPFTRQAFWISQSPLAIRSVSYDTPRSVRTLVSTGIRDPGDIHCDPVKQMLYWTDGNEVKSVRSNGTDDQTVITTLHNNNKGLVVHKSLVFWASHASNASINSGNLLRKVHSRLVSVASAEPIVDLDIVENFFQVDTRGACFENGGCDHYCVETGGATRECRCELGFDLQADGQSCRTERLTTNHILVADLIAARFYQVHLTTGEVKGMFHPKGNSPTVALSPDKSLVYWSDLPKRVILSSDLSGTNMKVVLSTGIPFADRLAVDPVTGNIFFSAVDTRGFNGSGYIGVVTPDGRAKRTLVPALNTPRAVALHSAKGIMFWSDHGFEAHIGRANMDGSERIKIITTDIEYANGIGIDFEEDQLYWSDGSRNVIERCTLFGIGRQVILTDPNAHLMAILIHEDKLYYTARNKPGITVVNKADGSGKHLLMESPTFAELSDFVIVQPNQHLSVNNGGCSALCLPTPTGRTCSCRDNVLLGSDGRTCAGDKPGKPSTKPPTTSQTTTSTASPVATNLQALGDNAVVVIAFVTSSGSVVVVAIVVVILVALIFRMRKNNRRPTQTVRYTSEYTSDPNSPAQRDSTYFTIQDDGMIQNTDPSPYSPYYACELPQDPTYLTPCSSSVKPATPEDSDGHCARSFRPPMPLPQSNDGDSSPGGVN